MIRNETALIDGFPETIPELSPVGGEKEQEAGRDMEFSLPTSRALPAETLTALQSELAAVNSSVLALVNPYAESESGDSSRRVKMETE